MVLKHAIDPLMEATGKLYGGRVPQVCVQHLHGNVHGTTAPP